MSGIILRIIHGVLGGYYYSLSFYAISLVLAVSALAKYLISILTPGIIYDGAYRDAFQLSIFLLIPLFAILAKRKYKFELVMKGSSIVEGFPRWACLFFWLILLIDFVLFGYLIVA